MTPLSQNLAKEQARPLTKLVIKQRCCNLEKTHTRGLLDRTSSGPCEEANGPGAGGSRVHHILVELEGGRLQQP